MTVNDQGNSMYQDPPKPCPICGERLIPHDGPEDGPAQSWAHPCSDCRIGGMEGIKEPQLIALHVLHWVNGRVAGWSTMSESEMRAALSDIEDELEAAELI